MGVNGGAGNTISFSEIQTFYGGSNPISISEYYRGGSEVPTNAIAAQAETSGTSDQTIGEFTADVTSTSAFTGALSNGSFASSISIQSDTAKVEIFNNHPDEDGGSSSLTTTVFRNGSSIGNFGTFDSTGNGALILACTIAGPANNGAVSSPNGGTFSSGTITASGTFLMREVTRASVTTHDVDFTNNSSATLTTTSGSTGGAQTYTSGQTRKVKDDQSTNNYVLGYDAVAGNTNVPTSGTINIDIFNAPGNPAA
jgi:hypothetical protein|tara:strand:- start:95 stop:859 length:765 start_codon:yes stop_codon:yes gene_type:complete